MSPQHVILYRVPMGIEDDAVDRPLGRNKKVRRRHLVGFDQPQVELNGGR